MNFTPDQLRAIDLGQRHLDACVVAGPGSGKTTVLVEYFRRLVEAGVDPLRILAITFTEKAAGNMRKKLAGAFQDQPSTRGRLERAWVSTVHGFCARLLKENAVFAGVDPDFYVADERESWRQQQESIAAAMESLFEEHPAEVRALIRGLSSPEFEEAVLGAYDAMRGAGIAVAELPNFPTPAGAGIAEIARTLAELRADRLSAWNYEQKQHCETIVETASRIVETADARQALGAMEQFTCNLRKCKRGSTGYALVQQLKEQIDEARYTLITECYGQERRLLIDILLRFDRIYRERKRQAGALDFADLEEFAVRLLEDHPATRDLLRSQFDHILMDEFQDTNGQQARLLRLVRPPDRFYAVGDINQSIFGFRHAEPQGFQEYRNEVESSGRRLVELVDNFRSRPAILSAVETVLDGAEGIEPRALVAGRKFDTESPLSVEMLSAATEEIEAQWVARRILELAAGRFQDVAVLVRNTEVFGYISTALEDAGIPYLVNRGRGFYESREVNDLTHLLRVIANPRDEISMAVVLRSPLVEASDEALLHLRMSGENIGSALLGMRAPGPFSAADWAKLSRFRDRLGEWRARREYVTFDRLLLAAIDDSGYPAAPNLDKFLAQARLAAARMSLDEFVDELALVRAQNPREPDAPPEDSANAVRLMTVHSAKGLEFPIVFLAGLQKGIDTDPPVVAFSRTHGLGARWRVPTARKDKDDLVQHAIRKERKMRECEESHRLLYVAMTRAEQHLVLSFAGKPKEWAALIAAKLAIGNLEPPREELLKRTAPDGKTWGLRFIAADRAPERIARPQAEDAAAAVDLLPPPRMEEQQNANATVTALAAFAHCPRQYYLQHYLGFEGRPRVAGGDAGGCTLSAAEFGTQVHALLAGTVVPDPDPDAVKLAGVFRQSALGRRSGRATRMEREYDFLMSVEDLVVRGQVDLWFEEAGELVIVDYKTDAVPAIEAHNRAQEYSLQLRLYAMAIEQVAGRPPKRALLYFLRPNTPVEVDLTPSLLESPEQVARDFQDAQSRLDFPLREGPHCHRCAFHRDLCPAGLAKK